MVFKCPHCGCRRLRFWQSEALVVDTTTGRVTFDLSQADELDFEAGYVCAGCGYNPEQHPRPEHDLLRDYIENQWNEYGVEADIAGDSVALADKQLCLAAVDMQHTAALLWRLLWGKASEADKEDLWDTWEPGGYYFRLRKTTLARKVKSVLEARTKKS